MNPTFHVLIIDDNPYDRELARRELARAFSTIEIEEIAGIQEFERALDVGRFDAVITDYQLRWSDGMTILRTVRERSPYCPVIMFTATGNEELAVEAMKSGLDDYIVKSLKHYTRLPTALKGARQRAELARRTASLEQERDQLLQREHAARIVAERAAERTARLQRLTAALAVALTPAQVSDAVLEHGMAVLGAQAGSVVLLSENRTTIRTVGAVGYAPELLKTWREFPVDAPVPLADAVRSEAPVWLEADPVRDRRYPQLAHIPPTGYHAWAAVPLLVTGRAIGAIGLSFAEEQAFGAEDRAFMLTLAHQCAQVIDRARLYESERRAHVAAEALRRRQAFLAESSRVLGSSLDYEATLTAVARLVVPELADWCGVYILDERSTIQLLGVAHRDPSHVALAYELHRRYPPDLDAPHGLGAVLRAGQSQLFPRLTDAVWEAVARDAGHLELVRALGLHSMMILPLTTRGRTLGALTFAWSESDKQYAMDDLQLAEELARRAAVAVDNARLYQSAQEAVRVRDIFLSIASHELKTPLTSLIGYTELLQRRAEREGTIPERDRRALQVINEQSMRLNILINALLDLSRINAGQLSIDRGPVELAGLVRRVVEEVRPTLLQHTIELEETGVPLAIDGDALRLEQVFQNLLSNAVKYSPAGGLVAIHVARRDDRAAVAISDQGIGIPEASRAHLFQRFYRAGNVDPRQISGMGIGLYIVREIVSLHGGEVQVESMEGAGSTFTVLLPLTKLRIEN